MNLLSTAKKLADLVESEATAAKVPVTVCVMDPHGNVVLQASHGEGPDILASKSRSEKPTPPRLSACGRQTSCHSCSRGRSSFPLVFSPEADLSRWAAAYRLSGKDGGFRRCWGERRRHRRAGCRHR